MEARLPERLREHGWAAVSRWNRGPPHVGPWFVDSRARQCRGTKLPHWDSSRRMDRLGRRSRIGADLLPPVLAPASPDDIHLAAEVALLLQHLGYLRVDKRLDSLFSMRAELRRSCGRCLGEVGKHGVRGGIRWGMKQRRERGKVRARGRGGRRGRRSLGCGGQRSRLGLHRQEQLKRPRILRAILARCRYLFSILTEI
jgi:hypothetical protein